MYVCQKCGLTTQNKFNFLKHLAKKKPCGLKLSKKDEANLLDSDQFFSGLADKSDKTEQVKESIETILEKSRKKTVKNDKKVIKKSDNEFVCSTCNEMFRSQATFYRHYKKAHEDKDKLKQKTTKIKQNEVQSESPRTTEINQAIQYVAHQSVTNNNNNLTNNLTNNQTNNLNIVNDRNIYPFEYEDFSFIDDLEFVEEMFKDREKKGHHSLEFFESINQKLINSPKNHNVYIHGLYAKNVMCLNPLYKITKLPTLDAVFLRIKTIYLNLKKRLFYIKENNPQIFVNIYIKYAHLKVFHFGKDDVESMLGYLNEHIHGLYHNYLHDRFDSPNVKNETIRNIISQLLDVRNSTGLFFELMNKENGKHHFSLLYGK